MENKRYSANVKLSRKPVNAFDAYNLLIEALQTDIREKQEVLAEMETLQSKEIFINNWEPNVKSMTFEIIREDDVLCPL